MNYKCVCGKLHIIEKGKEIRCGDNGHNVYISSEYWDYELSEKKNDKQLKIF